MIMDWRRWISFNFLSEKLKKKSKEKDLSRQRKVGLGDHGLGEAEGGYYMGEDDQVTIDRSRC